MGYPSKDEIGIVDQTTLDISQTLAAIPGAVSGYMHDEKRAFALPAPDKKTTPATIKVVAVEQKTKEGVSTLGKNKGQPYKSVVEENKMFETLYTLKFHSRCAFDVHNLFIGFADRLVKIIKNSDKHPYDDMGLPHFDMKDIKTKDTLSDILEPNGDKAVGDKSTVSISFRTSGGTFKHYYDFELNTYLPYGKEHVSFIETEFVVKSDRKLREDAALYKPEVNSFIEWFGRHLEIMLYTTYHILSDSRDSKLTNLRKDVLDFIDREMFSDLLSDDEDLRCFSFETHNNNKIPLQQDIRFDFNRYNSNKLESQTNPYH